MDSTSEQVLRVEFEIRSYRETDYADVRLNLDQGDLTDPDRDIPECLAEKSRRDPGSIIVAAAKDGAILGNVFTIFDGWGAFIYRLAVRQEYRGKDAEFGGKTLGVHLMEAAEERLRILRVVDVTIVVDESKQKLKHWYEKDGYIPTGLYRLMYKTLLKGD